MYTTSILKAVLFQAIQFSKNSDSLSLAQAHILVLFNT